jgi:hypothetical protein
MSCSDSRDGGPGMQIAKGVTEEDEEEEKCN